MKIPPQTPNTNRVFDSVSVEFPCLIFRGYKHALELILELSNPGTPGQRGRGSNRFSAPRDAPRHTRARRTGRLHSGNARKTASLRFVRRARVPCTTANCLWEVPTRGSRQSWIGTQDLSGCGARDELPRGPRVAGGRGVEQCRGDGTGERLHRGIVSGQRRRLPRQDHQGERIPRPAQRLRLRWHARLSAHRFSWTRPPDARSLALTSPFPKPLVPPRSRRRSPRMSRTSSSPPSP